MRIAPRSPTLDKYVCTSVFACMSSSKHGIFSQTGPKFAKIAAICDMIQKFAAGAQIRESCDCCKVFTALAISACCVDVHDTNVLFYHASAHMMHIGNTVC